MAHFKMGETKSVLRGTSILQNVSGLTNIKIEKLIIELIIRNMFGYDLYLTSIVRDLMLSVEGPLRGVGAALSDLPFDLRQWWTVPQS